MTDIYIDRGNMEIRLGEVIRRVDESDVVLADLPTAPNAGIASSIMALVASAGAEAAGVANDAARALSAITLDVLNDMTLIDERVAEEIRGIEKELDGE